MTDVPALADAVRLTGIAGDLERLPVGRPHANEHFAVVSNGLPIAFVKLYRGKPEWRSAERTVNAPLVSLGVPTPVLIGADLDAPTPWAAFAWHDLHPVKLGNASAREAGVILRQIHSANTFAHPILGLEAYRRPTLLLRDAAGLVAGSPHERALRTLLIGSVPHFRPPVLLHGDFGVRNLWRDSRRGLTVIDFEHARFGPPEIDFAKLWDRELAAEGARRSFLAGYGREPGAEPLALLWMRAWAIALLHHYGVTNADPTAISDAARALVAIERDIEAL